MQIQCTPTNYSISYSFGACTSYFVGQQRIIPGNCGQGLLFITKLTYIPKVGSSRTNCRIDSNILEHVLLWRPQSVMIEIIIKMTRLILKLINRNVEAN